MKQEELDEKYMCRCLQLARNGQLLAKPNPMVGAVIVSKEGRIIGEGRRDNQWLIVFTRQVANASHRRFFLTSIYTLSTTIYNMRIVSRILVIISLSVGVR